MSRALAAAVVEGGADAALAVCRACVTWLPMTGASITIMDDEQGQEPVCATDPGAARIDELQFSLGDGPCVESFRTGRAVLVADITDPAETRWPVFAAAAAETGARGMFVFPLHVGATKIGVLDCYRDTPGGLSDQDLSGALRAADAAVWLLLEHPDPNSIIGDHDPNSTDTDGADSGQWWDGLTLSRAEVHQATGALIAQSGLDAPAALARLRALAFRTGRDITEVADDVLARRLRLGPDGAWQTTSTDHPTDGRPGGHDNTGREDSDP
ncbi:GAF domain-containing protein [Actinomycetospora sp.]|uniref:GAF domain-containing protein n=1 Tax=Actinomycetospora sp. TaxID=1872135 RepID=UPI002F3FCD1E